MLTQELISVLHQVSDDLHRSGFLSKIRNQENSAYTGVDLGLKTGFTKIVPTPVFPLTWPGKGGQAYCKI